LILRPDARITTAAGPLLGNDVYSAAGTGQEKAISVQRGHSGTLYADVQNDGLVPDALKVTGPSGANGFTVTYFHGASNVTSQVVAGNFSTGTLAPGSHATLKVVIDVAVGSANSRTFLVSARSYPGIPVDAVKATVNAT
jgi:hypothetical protein